MRRLARIFAESLMKLVAFAMAIVVAVVVVLLLHFVLFLSLPTLLTAQSAVMEVVHQVTHAGGQAVIPRHG
jgi:hypothetical protein